MAKQMHRRGSNAVPFDGSKLNAALARRKISNKRAAKALGITPNYLSVMKNRGTITLENRTLLRNVLGIAEEEYINNAVQVVAFEDRVPSRPEECLLLRRDELKSIVREAVLDLLREIGGAVA